MGSGWIFLIQASPVAGQEPSDGFESAASVAFQADILEKPIVSHEGYFQLNWEVTGASGFDGSFRVSSVVDSITEGSSDGQQSLGASAEEAENGIPERVVYEGTLPSAFVSGLPDGTYRYRVEALDANGRVIATSEVPATVQVQHWAVWQATLLLAIGAIVFLAVIVVIVRGTWMHRSTSMVAETNDQAPAEGSEA
ncbi:hypothetical protein [Rhodopirellula europaea]|uniref:Signal peptide protein n=1 Tax=Rhodopirellula europaea 6C TaxID=1263867 RepID=M2AYK1_9BACT|nr:hypothetical protein [Rhodopirellula europaea]EMB14618.1 signal peptide protein [Rhodopirellula europaea 6C]